MKNDMEVGSLVQKRGELIEGMPEVVTTTEVATFLNVDYKTVLRLITDKKLPAFRVGSDYRILNEDLKKYLEKGKVKVENKPKRHY